MNKNIAKLIADVSQKCIENKINFRLEYASQVDTKNIPCSGYFDEQSLVVAVKKKTVQDWLDILVHESCHLDQFIEKSPYWYPDDIGLFVVEGWLKGKKYNFKKVYSAFINTIAMEMDCERRTIQKIKRYKLPINVALYTQKANSYLFGYGAVYKDKFWPKEPYENPKIYLKMPKKFLTPEEYFNIPDNYLKLYK